MRTHSENRQPLKYDAVIIGAGPGGLHCGQILARNGVRVLILEKNDIIGPKVCAGGITWKGLIERVPPELIERSFYSQNVSTRLQQVKLQSAHPIIATINRSRLGQFMAENVLSAGADIITGARAVQIEEKSITYRYKKKNRKVSFDYLVGADGSLSTVRETLKLSADIFGIGINYTLPQVVDDMEWNFDTGKFGSGYTWIFPHSESVSVGAYASMPSFRASRLNRYLVQWLTDKKFILSGLRPEAEKISCDFRGWKFGNRFLVGDAAGLASPLTGEGIYPAFVSAEAAAHSIIDNAHESAALKKLLNKHKKHSTMHRMACRHNMVAFFLSEISALLLRYRLISFDSFEMA